MRKKDSRDCTAGGLLLLLFVTLAHLLVSAFAASSPDTPPQDEKVFIQISGDIQSPGIYGFCEPPDLRKLVNRAGGLVSETQDPLPYSSVRYPCGSSIDLRSGRDTFHIVKREMPAAYKFTLGIPVSLNGEPEEGLTVIPGFGPKIAGAIVRERTRRGGFKRLDEILDIPGIGPALFKKVSRYLAL